MRKKLTILFISILSAYFIMSSGYGKWQKQLTIEGSIKVIPDPKVLEQMDLDLDALLLAEEQRIAEELRLTEEQRLLEIQKALEEQKQLDLLLNPPVEEVSSQPSAPRSEPSIEDDAIEVENPVDNQIKQPMETSIKDNNSGDTNTQESEDAKDDKVEKEEPKREVKENITNDDNINNSDKNQSSSNISVDRVENNVDSDSADSSN